MRERRGLGQHPRHGAAQHPQLRHPHRGVGGLQVLESRAWPGHPILIPRGGPRPWRSYQLSRAKRCAYQRFPRSSLSVRGEVMRSYNPARTGARTPCRRCSKLAIWQSGFLTRCGRARRGYLLAKTSWRTATATSGLSLNSPSTPSL